MRDDFPIDETNCRECPLWETSYHGDVRRSGIYGRGTGRNGLWIYGEAITAEGILLSSPSAGTGGQLLTELIRDAGINEDECYITNGYRCKPNTKKPKVEHLKACMDKHALLDVPKTPPKLILTLGSIALKAVLNLDKVNERRGTLHKSDRFNCDVLPTFSPKAILIDPRKYDTIRQDFLKAREFIHDQSEKAPVIHKELINSKESFLVWMKTLIQPEFKDRYCDLETTGLTFFRDKIVSIAFTVELEDELYSIAFLTVPREGWWYADLDDPEIKEALQAVFLFPIDFHNGLFDCKFIWFAGYQVKFGDDTSDQHLMIDENSPHNLQYLITIYNRFGGEEHHKKQFAEMEYSKGEFYKAPPELLLDINLDDTTHGFLLKKKFVPLMKAEKTYDFYTKLQMPLKRVLTKMSYRGIMMDREGLMRKSDEYREKIKLKEEELYDVAHQRFKYSSTKDLSRVLYKDLSLPVVKTTPTNLPSTDKEALEILAELHQVPRLITELRFLKGTIQKYLDGNDLGDEIDPNNGFLRFLDDNDRIHGPFLSTGTISGRPSCPKPNLLNIPKNPEIRSLFIAPEGFKLIDFDYSQAEMVLLAYLAKDPQFMSDVMDTDFHAATQKSLMKTDKVDDIIRRIAKSINFLKSYGGGAVKLSKTLRSLEEKRHKETFGVAGKLMNVRCQNRNAWIHSRKIPMPINYDSVNKDRTLCYVCEADSWLKKWDDVYPLVPIFKDEQKLKWRTQKYIEGIYGRKKRFPPALTTQIESYYDRIAVNFMCQNGVGDAINSALVDLDDLINTLFHWTPEKCLSIPGIVLSVYDSILAEVPDYFVPTMVEVMTLVMGIELPKLNISLKMDINVSQKWGEKIKVIEEARPDEREFYG